MVLPMKPIFISHATADDAAVDRIHAALTAAGIDMWVDHKRLKPGDDWEMRNSSRRLTTVRLGCTCFRRVPTTALSAGTKFVPSLT